MAKIIIEISKKDIRKAAALLKKDLTGNQVDDLYSKDVTFSLEEHCCEYVKDTKLKAIHNFLQECLFIKVAHFVENSLFCEF